MAMSPLRSDLFKSVCPVTPCPFAEARATREDGRAALLEHIRVTHLDDAIVPITSVEEQAPQ